MGGDEAREDGVRERHVEKPQKTEERRSGSGCSTCGKTECAVPPSHRHCSARYFTCLHDYFILIIDHQAIITEYLTSLLHCAMHVHCTYQATLLDLFFKRFLIEISIN